MGRIRDVGLHLNFNGNWGSPKLLNLGIVEFWSAVYQLLHKNFVFKNQSLTRVVTLFP